MARKKKTDDDTQILTPADVAVVTPEMLGVDGETHDAVKKHGTHWGKHKHKVSADKGDPHYITCIYCDTVLGTRQLDVGVDPATRSSGLVCSSEKCQNELAMRKAAGIPPE